jgi:pimeloyl-ACP methyl ester carboxylesterase
LNGAPSLEFHSGVAVWRGGARDAGLDVWFLPALADSHRAYAEAFDHRIAERARLFILDWPGHGASPALASGLSIDRAAELCGELVSGLSAGRKVVLVGHSMASMVAARAVPQLSTPPLLVLSIEGNLVPQDGFLTGKAARFASPGPFHAWLREVVRDMAERGIAPGRYESSLCFADARTLWTLGRSTAAIDDPGAEYAALPCPTMYYWDPASLTPEGRTFVEDRRLRNRTFERAGHWPMVTTPSRFYEAIEQDIA